MLKWLKVNDRLQNNNKEWFTVVKINNCNSIEIQFDGYSQIIVVSSGNLKAGKIKNRHSKSFMGVGILGNFKEKSKDSKIYQSWANMLKRCYNKKVHKDQPCYKNVKVCKDWLLLDNYANWYNLQYKEEGWQLDKDLLNPLSKEYSPDNCTFIPSEINKFIVNNISKTTSLPLGVTKGIGKLKYTVNCTINGVSKYLGQYETKELAFDAFLKAKAENSKYLAEKWKSKLPLHVYNKLVNLNFKDYIQ